MLGGYSRPVYLCNDLEAATVVLDHVKASHLLADVQFSGRFGFEGLTIVADIRAKQPFCRIGLMSGYDSESLRDEAIARGAHAFIGKPFESAELAQFIGSEPSSFDFDEAEIIRFPSLEEITGGPGLFAHVQPIVDLRDDLTYGYEALARYENGPLPGNGWLFDYARLRGRSFELNAACVRRAIAAAAELPAGSRLFLNVDPGVLADKRDLSKTILAAAAANGIEPERLVVELTEEMPMAGAPQALETIGRLRSAGVQFALDDFGTGYVHLGYAAAIRPSFMKISQNLGTAFECDEAKGRIVGGISALAKALDCLLIIEGVETEATAAAVRNAGIPLAQGYFFAMPDAAEAFTSDNCCSGWQFFGVPLTVA